MLRIDLLPPGVRRARTNKKLLALIVLLLVPVALGVLFYATTLQSKLTGLQADYTKVKEEADKVRATEAETGGIRGRLQPIADKISFIRQADECGYPYWERFFEIAEYIYGGAELRFFGIMAHAAGGLVGGGDPEALYQQTGPSGGSPDCAFGVTVKNANECARFMLNIIRCPEVSNLRISGTIPSGRAIAAKWPQILQQWNLPSLGGIPTMNVEGLSFSGGGGGGGAAGGGMPGMEGGAMPAGDMGAMPGGPGGGMPGGPGGDMGMGGRGGMGGSGGAASSVVQPRLDGSIDLLITCQLNKPIMVPSPPGLGGAAAAGGMGGGDMMGPGGGMGSMPGGDMGGMPGGGGPPGGGAGAPPGGAGGPPGGEAAAGPPGGGGGGDEGGGGGDE